MFGLMAYLFGMVPANEVLAGNVRRLRHAMRMSMSELAAATGVGKATLSAIESGQANPRFDTLVALAEAMDVEVGELTDPPEYEDVRVLLPDDAPREQLGGAVARVLERRSWFEVLALDVPGAAEGELPAIAGSSRAIYVIDGRLETGPVERPTQLGTGAYMTFPGDTPTLLRTDRRPARALLIDIRV